MVATTARTETRHQDDPRTAGTRIVEAEGRLAFSASRAAVLTNEGPPPAGSLGAWLALQVASISLQIEHAQAVEQAARRRMVLRAELAWDDDRRLAATVLGEKLAQHPGPVVEQLRRTPHGCRWMIERWAMLAHAADKLGAWTPEQVSIAFDLLGTPEEFREGSEPGDGMALDGKRAATIRDRAGLARGQVHDLLQQIEAVQGLDEADRREAEAGLTDDLEIRRIRRHEATLQRRLQWTLETLQEVANGPPTPTPTPASPPPPHKSPAFPRSDQKDPEIAGSATPAGPANRSTERAEKKLLKAEARREARSRKLDRHRG